MTVKEWLSRGYHLDRRIRAKVRRTESLLALATRASAMYDEAGARGLGNATSRLEDAAVRLADLSDEIARESEELAKVLSETRRAIAAVGDDTSRDILEMRYIDMMRWEEIASTLSLSVDYTYQLHRRALEMVRMK